MTQFRHEKEAGTFWVVFLSLVGLFVLSCFGRAVNVDDGWLGEPAMWLAKDGIIRSQALQGWENANVHLLFTHKLWVILGSFFVKLFGFGASQLKSLSAFYFGLLLLSWVYFLKKWQFENKTVLSFLVLLVVNSFFFEYGFMFRPEVALAFYSSWVYFLLWRYERDKKIGYVLAAGTLTAIAIGHHLNGVIIAGAGCFVLLSLRRYKYFLIYGVVSALGFGFYFIEVHSLADVAQMYAQFANTQDMRGEHGVKHFLFNLIDEQRRYLHSPREISLTLMLVASLSIAFKDLWPRYRTMLVYLGSMAVALAFIAHGKTSKYLLISMPFMLFLSAYVIETKWKTHKWILATTLFLYFGFQLERDIRFVLHRSSSIEAYDQFVGDLPKGTKVIAPMNAVFWAWDRYDMQAVEVYEVLNLRGSLKYEKLVLLQMMQDFGIQALILPTDMKDNFGISGDSFGPFKLVKQDPAGGLYYYRLDGSK